MKVKLINYTYEALELMLFTKQTRLNQNEATYQMIKDWTYEEKMAELEYMKNTIKSSWEFVDYTFMISDVTRAFTHQLVRHRQASYAQQSQRSVDMSGFDYHTGPSIEKDDGIQAIYDEAMGYINDTYSCLIEKGANPQDARGLLPTNILTNIVMKVNLRALHDMGLLRLCVKTQGETQDVFRAMRDAVGDVHPWAEDMIKVWCGTYGTCCFPTYPTEDCPVKKYVYNPKTARAYGDPGDANTHEPMGWLRSLEFIEGFQNENRGEAQTQVKK